MENLIPYRGRGQVFALRKPWRALELPGGVTAEFVKDGEVAYTILRSDHKLVPGCTQIALSMLELQHGLAPVEIVKVDGKDWLRLKPELLTRPNWRKGIELWDTDAKGPDAPNVSANAEMAIVTAVGSITKRGKVHSKLQELRSDRDAVAASGDTEKLAEHDAEQALFDERSEQCRVRVVEALTFAGGRRAELDRLKELRGADFTSHAEDLIAQQARRLASLLNPDARERLGV